MLLRNFASRLTALTILGIGSAFGQCPPAAWSAITPSFDSGVESLAVYNGELIAGGSFTSVGGVTVNGIARWDGSSWQPLGTGLTWAYGGVLAMTVYNGELIAAGSFDTAGGIVANRIARWNGSSWQPLGTGMGGPAGVQYVSALSVYNGELVAGGFFTSAGGVAANSIASWNGTSWQPVGPVLPVTVSIFALAVYNGQLIAAGSIPSINGIARWNGSIWQLLGTGLTGQPNTPNAPGYARSLAVFNGELVVGGFFEKAGGVVVNSIARWNGSSWQGFGTGTVGLIYQFGVVDELAVYDGDLIAGGQFSAINGVPLGRIGRFDGLAWQSLGSGLVAPNSFDTVLGLTTFKGSLVAGGYFTTAGGIPSPYLAHWSSPAPFLGFSQPGGPGAGLQVLNGWRIAGHEYYNVFSLEPCPGGLGTGPYGGLCFTDPAPLLQQVLLPIGSVPFHIVAGIANETYGPFLLPPGLAFEAISVDVTGNVVGCISAAVGYTTL